MVLRSDDIPNNAGAMNSALLWHLQLCQNVMDCFHYRAAGAHLSMAIDALANEAVSDQNLSDLDAVDDPDVRLMLALFAKHGGAAKRAQRRDRGSGKT